MLLVWYKWNHWSLTTFVRKTSPIVKSNRGLLHIWLNNVVLQRSLCSWSHFSFLIVLRKATSPCHLGYNHSNEALSSESNNHWCLPLLSCHEPLEKSVVIVSLSTRTPHRWQNYSTRDAVAAALGCTGCGPSYYWQLFIYFHFLLLNNWKPHQSIGIRAWVIFDCQPNAPLLGTRDTARRHLEGRG